jgi:hypothetical protein
MNMSRVTCERTSTPLARKLGLKPGHQLLVRHAPRGYRDWLAPIPAGVQFRSRLSSAVDVAHLFVTGTRSLEKELPKLRRALRPDATLWVSWPKRSAGTATDLSEDGIRALALPLGLVDVKVCAVSEVWSGLKLVVRKHLR